MPVVKLQAKRVSVEGDPSRIHSANMYYTSTCVEGGDTLVVDPKSIPSKLRDICKRNQDGYIMARAWPSITKVELKRGKWVYTEILYGDEYLDFFYREDLKGHRQQYPNAVEVL